MASKVFNNASDAVKDIKSGSVVLSSGFGLCGTPDTLIKAISENKDIQNLTCVSNNAGVGEKGLGELAIEWTSPLSVPSLTCDCVFRTTVTLWSSR